MSILYDDGGNDVFCLVRKRAGVAANSFKTVSKISDEAEWNGIPIYKEVPEAGIHNPIEIQDVLNALYYFQISPKDADGLMSIVISGRSPYSDELNSGWAFGAYQVIWEQKLQKQDGKKSIIKVPKENRLILWGQKLDKVRFNLGGEIREGYYYRIQPFYHGQAIDRYISVKALRREILGDTLVHELGHHVDIWHYGRYVGNSKDRAKAEKFAEAYSKAKAKEKREKPEFDLIVDGTFQIPQKAKKAVPQEQGNQQIQEPSNEQQNAPPQMPPQV